MAAEFLIQRRDTTRRTNKAPFADVVNDLHARGSLPWASVDVVLDSANRTGVVLDSGQLPPGTPLVQGWVWRDDDNTTSQWFPQGITTSADYHADGVYNGRKVILVSWYDKSDPTIDKGARVSFVDMTTPSAPKYRHVLLVEPYHDNDGMPNFAAVNIHAGGIMWYGDLLYAVDTDNGIRIFDTSKMLEVTATGDETTIGRQDDGSYTAHNYRYVLPQTHAYDAVPVPGEPGEPDLEEIDWSFISLDRTTTPDSIVVGEYAEKPGDGTRLIRWNIDSNTRLLKAVDGIATSVFAADVSIWGMQGATSVDGKYYISQSDGSRLGNLLTWVPPGNVVNSTPTPRGPEDVSYEAAEPGLLWSLTEHPGTRFVFARAISDRK